MRRQVRCSIDVLERLLKTCLSSLAVYALMSLKAWITKQLFEGFCSPSKHSHVLCRFLFGRSHVERKGASR